MFILRFDASELFSLWFSYQSICFLSFIIKFGFKCLAAFRFLNLDNFCAPHLFWLLYQAWVIYRWTFHVFMFGVLSICFDFNVFFILRFKFWYQFANARFLCRFLTHRHGTTNNSRFKCQILSSTQQMSFYASLEDCQKCPQFIEFVNQCMKEGGNS